MIHKHLKHLSWLIINILLDFVFVRSLRLFFLRKIFKFEVGHNSSIGTGFRFFRLSNIIIGANSVLNRNITLDNRDQVMIGTGVSISSNVFIYTAGHVSSESFAMTTRPVRIGDYRVIYSNSIINPGVCLPSGVQVDPGSVVFPDNYPPGAVLRGNPAVVIKIRDVIVRSHCYCNPYSL